MTEETARQPSRRVLLRKGLLLGAGAVVAGVATPLLTGTRTAQATSEELQFGWSWCYKCQGMFYGVWAGYSWCPSAPGARHDNSQSLNYQMSYGNLIPFSDPQYAWSWCYKCQGLFYGPWQGYSWCPASGRHDGSTSFYTYTMWYITG
jgi:hypothetical protein